ncbi:hypothetical protein [Desulfosporosinus shakirovi]|uniref:hypothetical protein n=1 Tax=Desulfosporosinus shakirovi TaxID=2885154 RepID=UPI001E5E5ACA|nr:hypothetical protein [Desulfosporosinus sp. SRJS8]MCB8817366.1 hypothetical protein [Desulfosporosinus sp. SRJS8]
MLMQEATPEMFEAREVTWNEYKDRLNPNRKSGAEIVAYLSGKYLLSKIHDDEALQVIIDNVLNNEPYAEKISVGNTPSPVAFFVKNTGKGKILFENQDEVFKENKIFVGVDLTSGFFCVEGSSMLWDELCAFQGLDEKDIQNPYCVAEYISCLRRFGLLDEIIDTVG